MSQEQPTREEMMQKRKDFAMTAVNIAMEVLAESE